MEEKINIFDYSLTKEEFQRITLDDQDLTSFILTVNDQFNKKGAHYFQKIRQQIQSKISSLPEIVKLDEYAQKNLSDKYLREGYFNASKQYPYMIKIRGDGNCFYRALIVGILITITQIKENECLRMMIRKIQQTQSFMYQLKDESVNISELDIGLILAKFFVQIIIEKTINEQFSVLQLLAEYNDLAEVDLSLNIFCRNIIYEYFDKHLKDPQYNQFIGDDMKTKIPFYLCLIGSEAEDVIIPLSANAYSYTIIIQNLFIDKQDKVYSDQIVYQPTVGDSFSKIILCYNQGHYNLLLSKEQSHIFEKYPPQIILNSSFIIKITKATRILRDQSLQLDFQDEKLSVLAELQNTQEQKEKQNGQNDISQKSSIIKYAQILKKAIGRGRKKQTQTNKNGNSGKEQPILIKIEDDCDENDKKNKNGEKKAKNFYQRLKNTTKQKEQKMYVQCFECKLKLEKPQNDINDGIQLCDICYNIQSNQLESNKSNKKQEKKLEERICQLCEKKLEQDENFQSEFYCKQCIKIELLSNFKQSDCICCKKNAFEQVNSVTYQDLFVGICQDCIKENYISVQQLSHKTLKVYIKDFLVYTVFRTNEKVDKFIQMLGEMSKMHIEEPDPICFLCNSNSLQFLFQTGNKYQRICLQCFINQKYGLNELADQNIQDVLWNIIKSEKESKCVICFQPQLNDCVSISDALQQFQIKICPICQKDGIFIFDNDDNISVFSNFLNHPLNVITQIEDKKMLKSVLKNNLN